MATANGFWVAYDYGDSIYTNRFDHLGRDWRWTIVEREPGKPEKLFAEYHLTPTACRAMKFSL